MATTLEISYFNSFWLKRLKNATQFQERLPDGELDFLSGVDPVGGGITTGTPDITTGEGYIDSNVNEDWFVEEARIEGGFNNASVDFGNKAYIVEEESRQERRKNAIIYSGVYNSKNGINNSNQFPIGEDITRAVDPASGSIQKLFAENTNLVIFQERKVNRAPIDKDVVFTQEGQPLTANSTLVIGTPTPFEGNFGICEDPSSFATYGYFKYFTDRDRGVTMQLGPNGLTEISNFGMIDYFRDTFNSLNSLSNQEIIGGYDIFQKNYVVTLASQTLHYDTSVNGWVSFQTYIPDLSTSLQGEYYTFAKSGVWKHYSNSNYNTFYGVTTESSVIFVFNPQPTLTKTFKTMEYTGSNGWEVVYSNVDYTGTDTNPQQPALGETDLEQEGNRILSYDEGFYTTKGVNYRAGFDRKQNKYYAPIKANNATLPGQVILGGGISPNGYSNNSGIKGMYLTVKFSTDGIASKEDSKQLFSVSTTYNNR
jgi:hypothetical protein